MNALGDGLRDRIDALRTGSRGWLVVVALAIAATAGGFALGFATADSPARTERDQRTAEQLGFAVGHAAGLERGQRRGRSAGTEAGLAKGTGLGTERGRLAAETTIEDALAFAEQRTAASRAEDEFGEPIGGAGSGGVLVVGDSLEVLTSPYLREYLPNARLTINVEGGYSSPQIFGLFREAYDPSQSVIVFDAGTNDNPAYPEILAGQLQAVTEVIGNRCMVVPTIHGLIVDGIDSDAKNRVVRSFAASRPGTQVPDWAEAVAARPELLQPDDLHPTPAGAAFRARLIARGVKECLALNPPGGDAG
jgi:hypothetical protein